MDIFHGNRVLEQAVIYGMEWGLYLRHKIDTPVIPYMFVYQGNKRQVRVLMTDGDPQEYAQQVLQSEEIPCDLVVMGMEGYLKDKDGGRHDSIIVQGFDRSHPEGVMLGQMFEPLEREGQFRRIDNMAYLGSPASWLETDEELSLPELGDDVGVSALSIKNGHLLRYQAFFSHDNPVQIATTVRLFMRSKIGGMDAADWDGCFDIQISPTSELDVAFLRFTVASSIDMEIDTPHAREWMTATGRSIDIYCRYGEEILYGEPLPSLEVVVPADLPPMPIPGDPLPTGTAKEDKAKPWWKIW